MSDDRTVKRILKIREFVIFLAVVVTALVFYATQPGEGNRFLSLFPETSIPEQS
jgi:hypothetical protein